MHLLFENRFCMESDTWYPKRKIWRGWSRSEAKNLEFERSGIREFFKPLSWAELRDISAPNKSCRMIHDILHPSLYGEKVKWSGLVKQSKVIRGLAFFPSSKSAMWVLVCWFIYLHFDFDQNYSLFEFVPLICGDLNKWEQWDMGFWDKCTLVPIQFRWTVRMRNAMKSRW